MPYQIDIWGGDLHQRHIGTKHFDDWPKVADFVSPLIDAGMLCNILHTDFQSPPERVAEAERDLIEYLSR